MVVAGKTKKRDLLTTSEVNQYTLGLATHCVEAHKNDVLLKTSEVTMHLNSLNAQEVNIHSHKRLMYTRTRCRNHGTDIHSDSLILHVSCQLHLHELHSSRPPASPTEEKSYTYFYDIDGLVVENLQRGQNLQDWRKMPLVQRNCIALTGAQRQGMEGTGERSQIFQLTKVA